MSKNYRINELINLNTEILYGNFVSLDENWKSDNVCDPFTRIYFVESGNGCLIHNSQKIQLSGGNVYLVPAGCLFSYGCKELKKFYFHIAISSIENSDLLSAVDNIYSMPFPENELQKMSELFSSKDYFDIIKLKGMIFSTILKFMDEKIQANYPIKTYSSCVISTMQIIRRNISVKLSAKQIAEELFISESKIRKQFKLETGMTIGEYRDNLIFFNAKKLLSKKDMRISDISESLGFCDQFYFARRFGEIYGTTPSAYRKEMYGF